MILFASRTRSIVCFSLTPVLGKSVFLLNPNYCAQKILVALDDDFLLKRFIMSFGRYLE